MHATVVNIKSNAPYDVYIGRDRVNRERGKWGNPYSHIDNVPGTIYVPTRDDAIMRHKVYLWESLQAGDVTLRDLAELHGKVLGCWCAPLACHGHTLASAAAWAYKQVQGKC